MLNKFFVWKMTNKYTLLIIPQKIHYDYVYFQYLITAKGNKQGNGLAGNSVLPFFC